MLEERRVEVKAGEHVGVLAGITDGATTKFVVNGVLVIAIGSGVDGAQDQAGAGGILVRLALNFEDVEKVVNASEFGKVWLARQSDDAKTGRKIVKLGDVVK